MAAEIITKEDLQEFGERLLSQMKALISGGSNEEPRKFFEELPGQEPAQNFQQYFTNAQG